MALLILLMLALAAAGIWALNVMQREVLNQRALINRMQERMDRLERGGARIMPEARVEEAQPVPEPEAAPVVKAPEREKAPATLTAKAPAKIVRAVEPATPRSPWEKKDEADTVRPVSPPPPPPPPPAPSLSFAERFEALVGGKLPIWIGAIALAFAAFFLVRYSIEQGLLGPGVRSAIAGTFGLALLVGSEAARRWPRTSDDPRIAQALAGAGIASLYGTLYMAGELFGLIGPVTAFALMALVTVAALVLSLRNGPPTAILGLVGGFAAPFLADSGSGAVVPILIYLALLIGGLFSLAIHRGWLWLSLAATGGGLLWSIAILFSERLGGGAELGLFIAALAIAGTLAMPRAGTAHRFMQLAPMVTGLLQLMILAPLVQFSATGWMLYGLLSAACLFLGWRDVRLLPAGALALALVCVLIFAAGGSDSEFTLAATIGATLLFAVPGHALALREEGRRWWSIIALGGTAGPLLAAFASGGLDVEDRVWALLFSVAAAVTAWLSLRARSIPGVALRGGAGVAAASAFIATCNALEAGWIPLAGFALACALAAWARTVSDRVIRWQSLLMLSVALFYWAVLIPFDEQRLIGSMLGDEAMPDLLPLVSRSILPTAALALLAWLHRGARSEQPLRWLGLASVAGLAMQLVPAPWHPAALAALLAAILLSNREAWLPRFGVEGLLSAVAFALVAPLSPFLNILAQSILLDWVAHYAALPGLTRVAMTLGAPLLILGGALWVARERIAVQTRPLAMALPGALAVAILYWVAKQPLAIATLEQFGASGFVERALITQALMAGAWLLARRGGVWLKAGGILLALALFRFIWFDLIGLNPAFEAQQVGGLPVLNAAVLHACAMGAWLWVGASLAPSERVTRWLREGALAVSLVAALALVRQVSQGSVMNAPEIPRGENYGYSAALLLLSMGWIWLGMKRGWGWARIAGLALLTLVTLKVFLIDAAALKGLLRVFSFLGLGAALMGIGWAYGRLAKAAREG